MYDAIIFDFDYTLGNSTKGIELSINYALEELGYPCQNTDEIKKTIGLSLKDTFKGLTSNQEDDKANQFAALFKKKADEVMVANTELYADAKGVLQSIREKGCMVGIVTTKFHYRIEQILHKFAATDLVDMIVGAEDVKLEKPSPEGLLWAIEHLKVDKQKVIYIGDSVVDAETAERAGVMFVGVLTGETRKEEFAEFSSVYVGENLTDVYKHIFVREG